MNPYDFDQSLGKTLIAGTDEVGRGPLAGPVVAASVILPAEPRIEGVADSKVLTPEQREAVFCEVQDVALSYEISIMSQIEIDRINILQASLKAMRESLLGLSQKPELILVDGNQKPGGGPLEMCIIRGDQKSAAIMAASVLAKVTRDHIMIEADKIYPQYGFAGNKGYGSQKHMKALKEFGPCPLHRRSFAPVRESLPKDDAVWETSSLVGKGSNSPESS